MVVLLTGHGLQLTLLPLKAQSLDWSSGLIGLTGSAYYAGFVLGCLCVPAIIRRVGHIRTFMTFVAVAAMAVMLASAIPEFALWLVLRFCTGCSLAALYTVVESWLNERTCNEQRGAVLALYTTLSLGAMAVGQLFVEIGALSLEQLFTISSLLLIAATLPVGLTSNAQPTPPGEVRINWRFVYGASHVGVICAGLSGVVVGLLWSMGAAYASDVVGSIEAGSRFVMSAILGGFVVQFPAGRLSDYVDRRLVVLCLALVGAAGASLALLAPGHAEPVLYLSAFLCGAGAMPMYSICVAHANDNANGNFLQIASGMLIAHALGSVVGPLLFAVLSATALPDAFALTILTSFTACIGWTLIRMRSHTVSRDYYEPYEPLPKTTAEAVSLDPRMDPTGQVIRNGPSGGDFFEPETESPRT